MIQIKRLTTTILIIFGLLIIGFQCKKDCIESASIDDPEYDYDFIVDMNVSPLQKVYNIGDTITLSFEISDNTLFDSKSQTDIELGNVEGNSIRFEMLFGVPYLQSLSATATGLRAFIITNQPDITEVSFISQTSIAVDIPCERFEDNFQFELKFVPLESGIFAMWQLLPKLPYQIVHFNPTGSCNDNLNDFQMGDISYKFNVADNNPELLEESPMPCDPNVVTKLEQRTDEKDFFWIKVE